MVKSMTAFGTAPGRHGDWRWDWELRSVNGRGLDLKLRLPEGLGDLEPDLRKRAAARLDRGTITAGLRLVRAGAAEAGAVDLAVLGAHLEQAQAVLRAAEQAAVPLAPLTLGEALALPGVVARAQDGPADLVRGDGRAAVLDSFAAALDALVAMRSNEGRALRGVLGGLLDRIRSSTQAAAGLADVRAAHQRASLSEALARVTGLSDSVDPDRLHQEIALIAVKGDVTEELERLEMHVTAAQALLEADGPVGRKLDFLTQEFNREANTLCSKAQYPGLTQIGLDLKAAIDQMREQVQNVE